MFSALEGLKVIEFAGLAPAPFAGLVLADWGADVVRIDHLDQSCSDVLCRRKRSLAVNLKVPAGREIVLKLASKADVLIEPFRPGVLEKLGFGPQVFLDREKGLNRRMIYARIAGFLPTGPYGDRAGHDINYLAQSGILAMLPGTTEKPTFPMNLLGDIAGGGLLCALGILLALQARTKTGRGQVVSTDIVSGTRYLSLFPLIHYEAEDSPYFESGEARHKRGSSLLDGGAPFYGVYTCSDGKWMSVGCLEPQYFRMFMETFVEALPQSFLQKQNGWVPGLKSLTDKDSWPRLRTFLENGFKKLTRDEWGKVFYGTDTCAVPVLSPAEAGRLSGSLIPAPHPNLSETPHVASNHRPLLEPGQHTEEILLSLGYSKQDMSRLRRARVIAAREAKL